MDAGRRDWLCLDVQLRGPSSTRGGLKHVALRHVSFRAYADYMETPDFLIGVEALLTLVGERSTAVM